MGSTDTNLKGEGIHKTPAEICRCRGWEEGTPILWSNPSARPITIKLVDDRAVVTRTGGGCLFVWDVERSEDFAKFEKVELSLNPPTPAEHCRNIGVKAGERIILPNGVNPLTVSKIGLADVVTTAPDGFIRIWSECHEADRRSFAMAMSYRPVSLTTPTKPLTPVEACKSVGAGVGDRIRIHYSTGQTHIRLVTAIGIEGVVYQELQDDGTFGQEWLWGYVPSRATFEKVEPRPKVPKVTIRKDAPDDGGVFVEIDGRSLIRLDVTCDGATKPSRYTVAGTDYLRYVGAEAIKARVERDLGIASPAGPKTETDDPWRGVAEFTKISGRLMVAMTILNDLITNGRIWVGKPRYDALMAFLNFKVNTPEEYDAFRLSVAASETNPPDIQPGPAVMKQVPERLPSAWGHK